MEHLFYKIVIEPQPEGGFTAFVPKSPGCVSRAKPTPKLSITSKRPSNYISERCEIDTARVAPMD